MKAIKKENLPELLKQIKEPPNLIYAKGNLELLKLNALAVVGTRHNTKYGAEVCKNFVKDLVKYDFCIISGLAARNR